MNYLWKITKIGNIETVGKNAMQKQSIVLEEVTDKEYKWGIVFDLIKDKVTLSSGLNIWDIIEVSLNFKATEYNGRDYNNVTAWKIEKKSEAVSDNFSEWLPF